MRLLLDTHTFIWADTEREKLSPRVADVLQDERSQVFLSVVSVWEMQIKVQLGKMTLRTDLATLVRQQLSQSRLQLLPVLLPHVLAVGQLPMHHKDPFDRLLIAQALHEKLTLLSADATVQRYPVQTVWA